MQTNEIQELLLDTIPAWHYWVRPSVQAHAERRRQP